jgi:hypothetical protein
MPRRRGLVVERLPVFADQTHDRFASALPGASIAAGHDLAVR